MYRITIHHDILTNKQLVVRGESFVGIFTGHLLKTQCPLVGIGLFTNVYNLSMINLLPLSTQYRLSVCIYVYVRLVVYACVCVCVRARARVRR